MTITPLSRARLAPLAAIAAVLAWGADAVAAGYNPGHLAPSDQAQVSGLCTGVVGLSRGNRQFDACMEALSGSVRPACLPHPCWRTVRLRSALARPEAP